MSQDQSNLAAAPPTKPGTLQRERAEAVWPSVIGVISIVLGSLGLLQYGINTVAAPLGRMFANRITAISGPQSGSVVAQVEAVEPYQWLGIGGNLFGLCLAILLLSSGISLVRRRPFGAIGHRWWAMLKFMHAAYAILIGWLIMNAQLDVMRNDPNMAQVPFGSSLASTFGRIGLMFMALFYAAYPIFVLVWFSRSSSRAEVERWRTRRAVV